MNVLIVLWAIMFGFSAMFYWWRIYLLIRFNDKIYWPRLISMIGMGVSWAMMAEFLSLSFEWGIGILLTGMILIWISAAGVAKSDKEKQSRQKEKEGDR